MLETGSPGSPPTAAPGSIDALLENVGIAESPSPSAFALVPEQLEALGCPAADHVFQRLQRPWSYAARDPALSRATAHWLIEHTDLRLPTLERSVAATDGATRIVFRSRGDAFEAVHMPRAVRSPRVTLCISSQVGCAMGCTFCATASMGLVRNLGAGEIVGQVLETMRRVGPTMGSELTLVFMGMGEPLHNVTEVVRAIAVLCHPRGLGLAPRRITVSTSGVISGIDALARAPNRPRLAISLNATADATRSAIMPVNRKWDLADLRAAVGRWPLEPRERILIEYVLLAGVNDHDDDVARLVAWLRGLPHVLNVIPFNPHGAAPGLEPSPPARVDAFAAALHAAGCRVTVRVNRGRDIAAACGQLVTLQRADINQTTA